MREIPFAKIDHIKVGHAQNLEAGTGCTVVLCEKGAAAGVDVRGSAPGTRETDLLNPIHLVEHVHAVLLTGGSAFGLDAASGVMRFLEEKNIGLDVGVGKVPIVPAAVLFDLNLGDPGVRPDMGMGYEACRNASKDNTEEGTVGAGTGATVGKLYGPSFAMKGGLGMYALQAGRLQVGALVAVNCLGDVVDPETGKTVAGLYNFREGKFLSTEAEIINGASRPHLLNGNTTIGVVATNAKLTKGQAAKIAQMAHDGFARTIRPVHTMYDGDTIFAMATGKAEADIHAVGVLAVKCVERAVVRAVKKARSLHGYVSFGDLEKKSGNDS